MVDTGGAQRHPASTERLMTYWAEGAGAKRINWDTPGDFARCQTEINAAIVKGGGKPLPDHEIKGLCARLHKRATGATPGHGPREQAMGDRHGNG
jgi:hypothetical protein